MAQENPCFNLFRVWYIVYIGMLLGGGGGGGGLAVPYDVLHNQAISNI